MIDMRRPKEREDEAKTMPEAAQIEPYPWGLRITLQTEELQKLGLKPKNFKLDEYVTIQAKGKVCEISESESVSSFDGSHQTVAIQLEQVDLEFEDKSNQTSLSDAIDRTNRKIK
jgi:hypothetical protein